VPTPRDPDAALHHAVPGLYKPNGTSRPGAPTAPAFPPTLADSSSPLPDLRAAPIGSTPIEDPASLGDVFSASNREAQRDNPVFDEKKLHDGYAPIVQALGLDPTENPSAFNDFDPATAAKVGPGSAPSQLATAAGVGESGGRFNMADRALQETLIAQAIAKHRQKDPKFLPGVPDTVEGLHAYFNAQEAKRSAADRATLARSPGGLPAFGVQLAGGAVGTFHDPLNVATLAIPGGEAKSLIQVAARDALMNGVIEAVEQPTAAHNRAELGQDYTAGDFVGNVTGAAVGGAVSAARFTAPASSAARRSTRSCRRSSRQCRIACNGGGPIG
jgi:hypothetical protein